MFQRNLFYLLILSLAWGLYKRLELPSSFLEGKANPYLSFKVYPVDLVLIFLMFFSLFKSALNLLHRRPTDTVRLPSLGQILILLLGFVFLLSSLNAAHSEVSFYLVLRLILYLFVYFWVGRFRPEKLFSQSLILVSLVLIVEGLLAMVQFWQQSYVFGFVPLGEPRFSASFLGSPLVNFGGQLKLRSFGTFPHPNVFGGFLAVTLPWLIFGINQEILRRRHFLFWGGLIFGFSALFLTFSQGAWGSFLIGFALYGLFYLFKDQPRLVKVFWTLVLVFSLTVIGQLTFEAPNSRRSDLYNLSLRLTAEKPWLGVGPGNFVYFSPPEWPEPVHNIFLLIASELGLPALIIFIFVILDHLRLAFKSGSWERKILAVSLLQIIFLGLFDHYLWTAPQFQLFFWLILGLISNSFRAAES